MSARRDFYCCLVAGCCCCCLVIIAIVAIVVGVAQQQPTPSPTSRPKLHLPHANQSSCADLVCPSQNPFHPACRLRDGVCIDQRCVPTSGYPPGCPVSACHGAYDGRLCSCPCVCLDRHRIAMACVSAPSPVPTPRQPSPPTPSQPSPPTPSQPSPPTPSQPSPPTPSQPSPPTPSQPSPPTPSQPSPPTPSQPSPPTQQPTLHPTEQPTEQPTPHPPTPEPTPHSEQNCNHSSSPLIITGVLNGARAGDLPRSVEMFAFRDIPDLSAFSVRAGADIPLSGDMAAGKFLFLTNNAFAFFSFFLFPANLTNALLDVNGVRSVQLLLDGTIVDTYGDEGVPCTNATCLYEDGWGYRRNDTASADVWFAEDWFFAPFSYTPSMARRTQSSQPYPACGYHCH